MNAVLPMKRRWPQFLAIVIIFIYCAVFLVNPQEWFPNSIQKTIHDAQGMVTRVIRRGVTAIAEGKPARELIIALYFLIAAGIVPLFVARVAGRGLKDLGWRRPNRLALRYFIVALAISAPFLIWMVRSPTIATLYLKQLDHLGFITFAAFYLVNMFTEHLLLHGVVQGLARPDGRWADSAPLPPPGKGLNRFLHWLGLAMPRAHATGQRVSSWLGLAPGCLIPMVFSALLFGMVHLGKDTRELVLAFPGGLAQAYIAYRSNSWFTPFLIHLATASAALAMMAWM